MILETITMVRVSRNGIIQQVSCPKNWLTQEMMFIFVIKYL